MRYLVQISSGVGPVEVRQFVAQLGARLEALCRDALLHVEEQITIGPQSAPRSIQLIVTGDARRALATQLGTHALLQVSPERGKRARKRWYASVAILEAPSARDDSGVELDPLDLEISACRASGPGGQHVNKTNSAVRVLHKPSGIAVRINSERSQAQNRRLACQRIAAELAARTARRDRAVREEHRLTHYRLERGAPVRTYRCQDDELVEVTNER